MSEVITSVSMDVSTPLLLRRLSDFKPSGRSPLGKLPGFSVAATGSYLPPQIVTNEDLRSLGCDSDWIVQRTGILERRKALDEQATSDLAYEAAIDCLKKGGMSPKDVDLVIVATMTPDHVTPSTACHLQRRLGCIAPAFDVNAACAGFMYAMVSAAQFVTSGLSKRALVVGSEVMSRTIDPSDPKTYPLFGDGAGAALLVPSTHSNRKPDGFLAYTLGAEGCGGEMLCIPGVAAALRSTPRMCIKGFSTCGWKDDRSSSGRYVSLKIASPTFWALGKSNPSNWPRSFFIKPTFASSMRRLATLEWPAIRSLSIWTDLVIPPPLAFLSH